MPHCTLYVPKQEKRRREPRQSRGAQELFSRCHMRLPLSPSMEPVATEPLEMALLSSILAAYSYISGGCCCLLARAVAWGSVLACFPLARV